MDNFLGKFDWRVIAAILVIFSFVGLFLVVISFSSHPKSNSIDGSANNPDITLDNEETNISPTESLPRKTYKDTRIEFTYPTDATLIEESIIDTGRVVQIVPSNETSWNIEIQETESSKVNLDTVVGVYTAYGLDRQMVNLIGMSVSKFSGFVVPPPNGVYQTSIAFQSGNYIYQISQYYSGDKRSREYELELENFFKDLIIYN